MLDVVENIIKQDSWEYSTVGAFLGCFRVRGVYGGNRWVLCVLALQIGGRPLLAA